MQIAGTPDQKLETLRVDEETDQVLQVIDGSLHQEVPGLVRIADQHPARPKVRGDTVVQIKYTNHQLSTIVQLLNVSCRIHNCSHYIITHFTAFCTE